MEPKHLIIQKARVTQNVRNIFRKKPPSRLIIFLFRSAEIFFFKNLLSTIILSLKAHSIHVFMTTTDAGAYQQGTLWS